MLWNTRAITVTTTATKAVLPMYLSSGTWTRTCWKFARVNGATEKANVSDAGLSAVITSQRNGARKTSPTAQAARLRRVEISEEHTSELQSREKLVCRLLLEKKKHD